MKTLSRSLALIISLQLAVGCTGSEMYSINNALPIPGVDVEEDSVSIEGSISRTFNTLSNLILPSAMAADGVITVSDVSEGNEIVLHQEELDGLSYKVKLKRDLVEGKLLKINYESYDNTRSRDLLIEASGVGKKISASLDEISSYQSKLLHAKLRNEIDNGNVVDKSSIRERFKELKQNDGEEEMNLLGDKELMLRIFKIPELAKIASEILAAHAQAKDSVERSELVRKLFAYAYKYEVINKPVLNCNGQEASVQSPDSGIDYRMHISAANDEGLVLVPDEKEFASFTTSDEARNRLEELMNKIIELSKEQGLNIGVNIRITLENEDVASCRVFGLGKVEDSSDAPDGLVRDERILNGVSYKGISSFDEGLKLLGEAFDKTMEELSERLIAAKIEKGSDYWNKIWEEQYTQNKEHYSKRVSDLEFSLKYGFDPLELSPDYRILNAVNFKELASFEDGQKLLEEAFHATVKDLESRMGESRLEPGSDQWNAIWNKQYDAAKTHFTKLNEELTVFFAK